MLLNILSLSLSLWVVDAVCDGRSVCLLSGAAVTIVDPHIKKDDGYYIYSEIDALDLWTKSRDNSAYTGWCWPGDSRYPDFANKKMREYWARQFALDKYAESTADLFIWNDMNEPSVFNGPEVSMPISNIHRYDGHEVRHSELHNLYGMTCTLTMCLLNE